MQISKVLAFICLFASLRLSAASFDLGTCNLECDGQSLVSGDSGTSIRSQLQGPSGKRGPQGEAGFPGQKGDSGEPYCNCTSEVNSVSSFFPRTCSDLIQSYGVDASGVYTIYPFGNSTGLLAYCDLITDGGGWMVFQRRIDGSEDFYRNFSDYVRGFGKISGEFWLGLSTIHELTKDGEYELRADMEDFDNDTRYAYYNIFSVGSGSDFTAVIRGYAGTAGDGMGGINGRKFSAKDFDQDTLEEGSCSHSYKGGWWYSACHSANPNGLYLGGDHDSYANGIDWNPFRGYRHSMKKMELKIRKKNQ